MIHSLQTRAARLLLLPLLAAACNDEPLSLGREDAAAGAAGAGEHDAGGAGGSAGAAGTGSCADAAAPPAGSVCVLETQGRVVDAAGAPVPDLTISVCGPVCFYGKTLADGSFVVPIGAPLLLSGYSTLTHGRPSLTSFYYPLPPSAGSQIDMGDLLVLPLPQTGPALIAKHDNAGAPAQSVISGDLTLDVAAGVSVRLDVEDILIGDAGRMFRALSIPAEHQARFAAPALGLTAVYALTPFEAAFVDPMTGAPAQARLTFANTQGFAPGTPIEVLALGSYLYADWLTPAAFELVATATVSANGKLIEMDAGLGLPYLTWVGLRPKP